jgi:GxxExxY protein
VGKNYIEDLVYPELSYKVIGCAYEVFNQLGYGYAEKHYQKAFAEVLKQRKIAFTEQYYTPIKVLEVVVVRGYCDFVIEDKIIVELKKNERFSQSNIQQVNQYLKSTGLKLGLLINFTPRGAIFKRLVNIKGNINPTKV